MHKRAAILLTGYEACDPVISTDGKQQETAVLLARALKQAIHPYMEANGWLEQAGLLAGCNFGRQEFIEKGGRQAARTGLKDYNNPRYFVNSIASASIGRVAMDFNLGGDTLNINTGLLSGIDTIGYAMCAAGFEDKLFFAGAVESRTAIIAATGDEKAGSSATIFSVCNTRSTLISHIPPVGYICDYKSLYVNNEAGRIEECMPGHHLTGDQTVWIIAFGNEVLSRVLSHKRYQHIGAIFFTDITYVKGSAVPVGAVGRLLKEIEPDNIVILMALAEDGKYSQLVLQF